jgi:hypothetical protein
MRCPQYYRGCGGSVDIALASKSRLSIRSSPEIESGNPHSLLNGARIIDCVSKTNLRLGGVPTELVFTDKKYFVKSNR